MLPEHFYERIAQALGWTAEQVRGVPLRGLRELLRPVSPKLAHEITCVLDRGQHLTRGRHA